MHFMTKFASYICDFLKFDGPNFLLFRGINPCIQSLRDYDVPGVIKMTYDANFKQLLPDFLGGCEIRANEPVGKLPLEIDLVITCPNTSRDGITIPVFNTHFASINIIEHKSSHVTPSRNDIAKIAGYVGLYCAQQKIPIEAIDSNVAAWYITAARPDFFDDLAVREVIAPSRVRDSTTSSAVPNLPSAPGPMLAAMVVPLIVPLMLVRHHVRRFQIPYLRGQVYLEPHPKELMLRNHV
jgi:hypothetical protein